MNFLIVDLQGFTIEQNRFLPKELAAYNGKEICHYVFKPPFPFKMLPLNLQKNATWLMNNYHCIRWQDGSTPLHQFEKIIEDLSDKADTIYVKGKEKAKFFQKYTPKRVVELDEQPSLQQSQPSCLYHFTNTKCMCALTNVYYLYKEFM